MIEPLYFLAFIAPAKPSRLRAFLLEVVNSQHETGALVKRLGRIFPEFVPRYDQLEKAFSFLKVAPFQHGIAKQWFDPQLASILRGNLRLAWRESHPLLRQTRLLRAEMPLWFYYDLFFQRLEQTPDEDDPALLATAASFYKLFEAAATAVNLQARFRYCGNPECVTPFFFESRRGQRFCSEQCAAVGNREAKKRWWKKHGKKWRRAKAKRRQTSRKEGK